MNTGFIESITHSLLHSFKIRFKNPKKKLTFNAAAIQTSLSSLAISSCMNFRLICGFCKMKGNCEICLFYFVFEGARNCPDTGMLYLRTALPNTLGRHAPWDSSNPCHPHCEWHWCVLCVVLTCSPPCVLPQGHADVVQTLAGVSCLEAVDDYSITPLFLAAQYGHSQCVEVLARAGARFGLSTVTYTTHSLSSVKASLALFVCCYIIRSEDNRL